MRDRHANATVFVVFAAAFSVACFAQRGAGPASQQSQPPIQTPASRSTFPQPMGIPTMGGIEPAGGMPDPLGGRLAEQQARTRNNERQKKIEADTDKLVGLVNELKDQVQSDKPIAPADLSKRAEEIEKLARSVKDRMKG
ncbi:MAG: hypothetical protein JST61_03905 [Acidobacteria bacterium]|nr:hypothetical protein [Acidobacteriota bacterium]